MPLDRGNIMIGIGLLNQLRFKRYWRRNRWTILVLFIVIPLFSALVFWGKEAVPLIVKKMERTKMDPTALSNDVFQSISGGDYNNAVNRLKQELDKHPDNASLKNLRSQLMDELKVDVKFHYLVDRKRYTVTRTLSPDITLTPKDPYYLSVNLSHGSYLFVFQVDSKGDIDLLHPNKEYSPSDNPLLPGPIRIPDGFRWFYLDETRGIETIYIIATRMENKRLEDLSRRISMEKNPDAVASLSQELISYMKGVESTAHGVPGVSLKVYQFSHG